MNKLFYVKGYHFRHNAWWRFVATASDEQAAKKIVQEYAPELTDVYVLYLCSTPDELFLDL